MRLIGKTIVQPLVQAATMFAAGVNVIAASLLAVGAAKALRFRGQMGFRCWSYFFSRVVLSCMNNFVD